MIDVRSYVNRRLSKISLSSANPIRGITWIDCYNPKNHDLKDVANKTGIFLTKLKDCLDPDERPRIEHTNRYSLIIFRAPYFGTDISTTPIGIFFTRRYVVTVHQDQIKTLDSLKTADIMEKGVSSVVYSLLLNIIRDYNIILDDIEDKADELERNLLFVKSERDVHKIFSLRRVLLYFRKSLISNRDVLNTINKAQFLDNLDMFSNLYIEILQVIDIVELLRERLNSALEIYLSAVSNKLNNVMKSFTIIASVLLLPMLVTGVYGMNFTWLPLIDHPFGFYFSVLVMVLSVSVLLMFFKKKNWL